MAARINDRECLKCRRIRQKEQLRLSSEKLENLLPAKFETDASSIKLPETKVCDGVQKAEKRMTMLSAATTSEQSELQRIVNKKWDMSLSRARSDLLWMS